MDQNESLDKNENSTLPDASDENENSTLTDTPDENEKDVVSALDTDDHTKTVESDTKQIDNTEKPDAESLLASENNAENTPFEEAFQNHLSSQPTPPAAPYYPPQQPNQPQYTVPQPSPNMPQQPINSTYDSIGSQTQYTNHYPGSNPYNYYNVPPTPQSGINNPPQPPIYPPEMQGNNSQPNMISQNQNINANADVNKQPYSWNFNNYKSSTSDKSDGDRSAKSSMKKMMRIILPICFIVVVIAVAAILNPNRKSGNLVSNDNGTSSSATNNLGDSDGIEIHDSKRDPNADTPEYNNVLTIKQVYAKVNPSIVAIQVFVPTGLTSDASGEGSGVIMSEDGYIITNAHVVADTTAIKVILSTEEVYEAEVIGSDLNTDLALLKINATGLTPAEFGDSTALEIGDLAIAIGNPGGLLFSGSATVGYISNLDRNIVDSHGFSMSCIQTDAAINPGNSGGALANDMGQVVGITSSKVAATSFEGMGFAIPMHEVKPIIDMLKQDGRVTGRPMIGITYSQVIDEMTGKMYGLPSGIIVTDVTSGTDAEAQGLKKGDIIHKIDETVIKEAADIHKELKNHKPGDSVKLTVFRRDFLDSTSNEGEELIIEIKLTENKSE